MTLITNKISIESEINIMSWELGEAIKSKEPELKLFRLLENSIHKDNLIPNYLKPINGSDLTDTLLLIVAIEQKSILSLVTLLAAGADPWSISKGGRWCEWDVPKTSEGPYKKEIMRAMDCLDSLSMFQEEGYTDGNSPKAYEVPPVYANMIYDLKMKQLAEERARDMALVEKTSSSTPHFKKPAPVIDMDYSTLPEYDDL